MSYPLLFEPILKERVWGGHNLERLYARPLPPGVPIGESWEITDRPEGVSVVTNGAWAGRSLRWLMEHHAANILGSASGGDRFPLLVKILDAADRLSLQVHPPAAIAQTLGGEPKTEMWFIAEATPEADLFVGLRRGTTPPEFRRRVADGTVAACFHRLPVRRGDAMFLPSGRVHAIGAGNVIFEIQQNSDTTYRVFDWNRLGLDGRARELHVEASLACIDFTDFEPELVASVWEPGDGGQCRRLADDPLFAVDAVRMGSGAERRLGAGRCWILGVSAGVLELRADGNSEPVTLRPGQFSLVPASTPGTSIRALAPSEFLQVTPGDPRR